MNTDPVPMRENLARRWRREKVTLSAGPVAWVMGAVALILLATVFFLPPTQPLLQIIVGLMAFTWASAFAYLAIRYLRRPSSAELAKRADHVFQLKDDLLALSELPQENASAWEQATWQKTSNTLSTRPLASAWPIRIPSTTFAGTFTALVLTALFGFVVWQKHQVLLTQIAQEEVARTERLAAAEEVLQDWEEFVKISDDEELKKLFAEAQNLQRALENPDPMVAMLEMNRLEAKMSALEKTIDQQSLASQAGAMADALEAFSGMSALSAALRDKNFAAAEEEARKLSEKFGKDPQGHTDLRRQNAVAEMLASTAKAAGQRGDNQLSQALSQLSELAQNARESSQVSNQNLKEPMQNLCNQFCQEKQRQNRGRMANLGRQQLESLRQKLRQEESPGECPSLCRAAGERPGGHEAGKGKGGDPQGDRTDLMAAGVTENVSGQPTADGESETRTLSSNSGTGVTAPSAKPATFSDYKELSEKAVADENLPLAHRMVIREYFERIRPVAEPISP